MKHINKFIKQRKIKYIFAVHLLLLCVSTKATGLSYIVNNYEGNIGKYPVHFSLQYYDFGRNINIKGSYYYDNHNSPIPLYGIHADDSVVLCEISNHYEFDRFMTQGDTYDSSQCPFKLKKNIDGLSGQWNNNHTALQVELKKQLNLMMIK